MLEESSRDCIDFGQASSMLERSVRLVPVDRSVCNVREGEGGKSGDHSRVCVSIGLLISARGNRTSPAGACPLASHDLADRTRLCFLHRGWFDRVSRGAERRHPLALQFATNCRARSFITNSCSFAKLESGFGDGSK